MSSIHESLAIPVYCKSDKHVKYNYDLDILVMPVGPIEIYRHSCDTMSCLRQRKVTVLYQVLLEYNSHIVYCFPQEHVF